MKHSLLYLTLMSITTTFSFICSYFLNLTLDNVEQFLAITCVVLLDGFFGVIAGIKREGFKTYKALNVLKTLGVWWIILGAILAAEKGFTSVEWMSETIIGPFVLFQLISALKNASMAGFIKQDTLNGILDKIDNHKGLRNNEIK